MRSARAATCIGRLCSSEEQRVVVTRVALLMPHGAFCLYCVYSHCAHLVMNPCYRTSSPGTHTIPGVNRYYSAG